MIREGEDLVVELPDELLAHLRIADGDEVVLTRTEEGIRLSRYDPALHDVELNRPA